MTLPMCPVLPFVAAAPVAAFDPATLYGSGQKGAWYDVQDLSTLFQNSDATTPATVGNPVGYMADKSGNGWHRIQSASGSRPILRVDGAGKNYLESDGFDDFLSGATFTAGSIGGTSMLCTTGIKIDKASGASVVWDGGAVQIFGIAESGSSAGAAFNAGSPSDYANGILVTPNNDRGALYTALSSAPTVWDCSVLDLSTWGAFMLGFYDAFGTQAYLGGRFYGAILTEHTELITTVRAWMAARIGVSI